MPIRAIGFDIDGTLYSARRLYLRLLARGMKSLKLMVAFNEARLDIRKLLDSPEYRARNIHGIEAFHRFQAELCARRMGADPEQTHEAIERFFYTAAVEPFASIPLYPGVIELLGALRERGIRLGALSDFPCERKVQLLGLGELFDVVMTSEETGLVKPDRASFDLLASRLGTPPEHILYVGNSEQYDVAGAMGAGMRTALITRSRRAAAGTAAEFAFSDYAQLRRYVLEHLED
ncbi:MAG TPA: HAD family hydrolase [bacterium]|nr:HAD family hydrolase [bacterium]